MFLSLTLTEVTTHLVYNSAYTWLLSEIANIKQCTFPKSYIAYLRMVSTTCSKFRWNFQNHQNFSQPNKPLISIYNAPYSVEVNLRLYSWFRSAANSNNTRQDPKMKQMSNRELKDLFKLGESQIL